MEHHFIDRCQRSAQSFGSKGRIESILSFIGPQKMKIRQN
jgi:hypothetical protein